MSEGPRPESMAPALPHLPRKIPSRVVGLSYASDYPHGVYRAVATQAPLMLQRDPENEYDANAIEVVAVSSREVLGFLRASTSRLLAPHLDADETWGVSSCQLEIADGHESHPGLLVTVERVEWAEDVPIQPPVPMGNEPKRRPRRRGGPPHMLRENPRQWGQRMLDLSDGIDVVPVVDGQFAVASLNKPGHYYSVVVDTDAQGLAMFLCHCPGGVFRPDQPIPCRHAAAVARRLEAFGELRILEGLAYQLEGVA